MNLMGASGSLWELPGTFWEPPESSLWKQISAIWRPFGRLLNFYSGIIGKRPFLAKSWPGSLVETIFCHLAALWPALEFLFWCHWETAVFGQIVAGRFSGSWEPSVTRLKACGCLLGAFWESLGILSAFNNLVTPFWDMVASGSLLGTSGCAFLKPFKEF